jgi:hypothetical protein
LRQHRRDGTKETDDFWWSSLDEKVLAVKAKKFERICEIAMDSIPIMKKILEEREYEATLKRMEESTRKKRKQIEELVLVEDDEVMDIIL